MAVSHNETVSHTKAISCKDAVCQPSPAPAAPAAHRKLRRRLSLLQGLRFTALASSLVVAAAAPAVAQREVPKIGDICPLGYVDLFNGKCSTLGLMNYTVQPTGGQACPSGWMNVGGGYCRLKR